MSKYDINMAIEYNVRELNIMEERNIMWDTKTIIK